MAADPKIRERNVAEQFEALGRFVQAFEDMVDDARVACMDIASDLGGDSKSDQHLHRTLLHIIFYHQSVTAKPIFEIMRAAIGQMLNDQEFQSRRGIDQEDQARFLEILAIVKRRIPEAHSDT